MRTDRLRALIERIRAEGPDRFDIRNFYSGPDGSRLPRGHEASHLRHNCGTAACIAGWAGVVAHPLGGVWRTPVEAVGAVHPIARWDIKDTSLWLGITYFSGLRLCAPTGYYRDDSGYTQARALAVLEHMLVAYEADGTVQVCWDLYDSEGGLV